MQHELDQWCDHAGVAQHSRIPANRGFWLNWFSSNPASASWNWTADANQRTMLLKAKACGANLFELFSNSPMWWMCYNSNPSGADAGTDDNLQSWNYQQHAIYLATVAKYARDHWGIAFDSVEPFNEPSANWWNADGTQEGCHFDTDTQAIVISHLRTELDSRALASVKVAVSDETSYDAARTTWSSFNATVKSQAGRINVHGYQYAGGRRDLLYTAVAGKKLWNSEYGEADGSGLSLAGNLNLDFRWLHLTAWCYWQPFDSGGWGLIQSNPGDNWIGSANPKYFVLAQYTRHIRPGMTVLESGDGNTLAAYDPAIRKLALVTVNYGTAQQISYCLTNFPFADGSIQRWMTATGTGPKYQLFTDTAMNQRNFHAWFPSNTIQTFEIQNVDLNAPASPLGLTAISGAGKVVLTWAPSVGATNYLLKRTIDGLGNYTVIASSIQTNYTDRNVICGTSYTYTVAAMNGAGQSAPSAMVTATPYPPPNLSFAIQTESGQLKLEWPAWATNYQPFQATNLTPPIHWSLVTNSLQTNGGTIYLMLLPPSGTMRFYRLKEQ